MTDKKLITHPASIEWLRANVEKVRDAIDKQCRPAMFSQIRVVMDSTMDIWHDSGLIVLPDGKLVDRKGFTWRTKFITYEESDIDILLYCRKVKVHMVRKFVIQDDFRLLARHDFEPRFPDSRFLIMGTF